jgi:hypothetical protein
LTAALEHTAKGGAAKILGNGFEIVINKSMGTGIRITPKGQAYFIDFTKESLQKFIEEYLGPITHKVLFK